MIAIDKETGSFTDEYLPEQRSHLYGITAVYPYCPGGKNTPNPTSSRLPDGCYVLDTLKISISLCSKEIVNGYFQKQQSLHPKKNFRPRNLSLHPTKGGKPFTKANEATDFPAKDYQVVFFKLYLKSLLLYFF